jgi:hypothetical protein
MTAARRLAATLAADVVGYSRLMGEDGARTARPTRMRARWTRRRPPWPKPAATVPNLTEESRAPRLPHLFEALIKAGLPEE